MASGGRLLAVTEDEISAARSDLAGRGFYVEPTGAVAWAGLMRVLGPAGSDGARGARGAGGPFVAVLTGR